MANQLAQTKFTRNDLKDNATKERIDKHLSDINDTISEEDIKNVNTNIALPEIEALYDDVNSPENDEDHKKNHKRDEPLSPWNIIDE